MKPVLIKLLGWLATVVPLLTAYHLTIYFAGLHPPFLVGFFYGLATGVIGWFVGGAAASWVYVRRMRKVVQRQSEATDA